MGVSLPARRVFSPAIMVRLPALLLSAALCSAAQAPPGATTTLITPPAPLLPDHLGTLRQQISSGAQEGIPGDAQTMTSVFQEDGLAGWQDANYGTGPAAVHLRAYRFNDATGAVAAYTLLRKPGAAALPPEVAANGAAEGTEVIAQSGVSVVAGTMPLPGAARDAAIREVLQHLPKVSGRQGMPPLLPTYVPGRGLIAGSMRYSLGPAGYAAAHGVLPPETIGFDKAAEAVTADYRLAKDQGRLTMLLYPTPEIAGQHTKALAEQIAAQTSNSGSALHEAKLRREGPLVLLATGELTSSAAQALVDGVHLRLDVSLDKPVPPEFHTEARKTASLLVSIAVLSGVLGLAAVLLGLFLGVGRASIRVLMGKPAATEPEFLRLDLSGGTPRSGDARSKV